MRDIVFFIESKNYLAFSIPYLNIFKKLNLNIEIYTLENFTIPNFHESNIKVFNNKNDLNKNLLGLECKNFFTTTPGIGNIYFPKSKVFPKKNRPKYFYFFHSLVSPNENYIENSFKGFDYILSPNEIITNQLYFLINEKRTFIHTVGYQHLNLDSRDIITDTKNVLIAPSWGTNNLFSEIHRSNLNNLIEKLISNNLKVYLRPHPMDSEVLKVLKNYENIELYLKEKVDHSNFDFVITDWSGISLEYFYARHKPVGFVNTEKKTRRKLGKKERNIELVECKIIEKIGPKIDLDRLDILDLLNFKYEKSDYIESLYLPRFDEENVKNLLTKLLQ